MPNVDSPWKVNSPWNGSAAIGITADQVLQSVLAGALLFTAVAVLVGIIETLRSRWWRKPKYVRLGVYSAICTILLAMILLSVYPLRNVSQSFLSMLLYVSIILLAELIPIIASDNVRNAFISETPLLSNIIKPIERRSATWINSIRLSEPDNSSLTATERNPGTHETSRSDEYAIPASSMEIRREPITSQTKHEGGESGLQATNVRRKAIVDPDYERYHRWSLENGLFLWKLDYREFAKIREVVNRVLGDGLFGMSGSRLDVAALCLLAKIDAREDIEKLMKSNRRAFEKLRKFKLVSDRGRLMPRGVRLVKALKREGLIEKLREHPL